MLLAAGHAPARPHIEQRNAALQICKGDDATRIVKLGQLKVGSLFFDKRRRYEPRIQRETHGEKSNHD